MKKYNIKGQKDTQKKRKMADIHCKGGKVLAFLSVRKLLWNWFNLIQRYAKKKGKWQIFIVKEEKS